MGLGQLGDLMMHNQLTNSLFFVDPTGNSFDATCFVSAFTTLFTFVAVMEKCRYAVQHEELLPGSKNYGVTVIRVQVQARSSIFVTQKSNR